MKVKSGTEKETALGIPRREAVEPEEGEKRGLGRAGEVGAGGRQTGGTWRDRDRGVRGGGRLLRSSEPCEAAGGGAEVEGGG